MQIKMQPSQVGHVIQQATRYLGGQKSYRAKSEYQADTASGTAQQQSL
jgi:hypothetical protein